MLAKTQALQFVTLTSDLNSLILEAKLIKTLLPPYNIRLKDDKSPLYIVTTSEPFPRVLTVRKAALSQSVLGIRNLKLEIRNFYGPFPSGLKARHILKTLRHIFPFCNATPKQKLKRQACFYFHLNLCPGACVGQISPSSYHLIIHRLEKVLSGQHQTVILSLTRQMKTAAKSQKFELAAKLRQSLQLLSQALETPLADEADELLQLDPQPALTQLSLLLKIPHPHRIEAYDISNLIGKQATGSMVVFLDGSPAPSEYRHFTIRTLTSPNGANDPAMMAEIIARRLRHPEWGTPNLIVVDGGKAQVNAAKTALKIHFPSSTFHLPVIGLAKRYETLIFDNHELKLPRSSKALHLIQHLRDEAHRFSRHLHLKLRHKTC